MENGIAVRVERNTVDYRVIFASVATVACFVLEQEDMIIATVALAVFAFIALSQCFSHRPMDQESAPEIGNADLAEWEKELEQFKSSPKAKELEEQDYFTWRSCQYENGKDNMGWGEKVEDRYPVLPAARRAVKEVFSDEVAKEAAILEIGSNSLNEEGLSYLARLLPKSYLKNLTFSDYISSFVQKESRKAKGRCYRLLDIRDPDDSLKGSQNCIAAVNVIDVIAKKDLGRFVEGCSKLLKKGGKVILLADRPIDKEALFAKFTERETLVFPWSEPVFAGAAMLIKGVKVVTVETLNKALESWEPRYRKFIDQFIELSLGQRNVFLQANFFRGKKLCQFLDAITQGMQRQEYLNDTTYENDVKEAFIAGNFTTRSIRWIKGEKVVDHPDPTYQATKGGQYNVINYNSRFGGPVVAEHRPNLILASGKIHLESHFHLMIFQKA